MGRVPILFFVGLGSEGAIRVKNVGAFVVAMMLAVLMPAWCAYAESRDAQVRYEVSATVIYVDGETETVQKVPVGSILKAPNPKGSTGGTFAGWWNEESGAYWDFSAPVEESMTLAAQYAYLESDEEALDLGPLPLQAARLSKPARCWKRAMRQRSLHCRCCCWAFLR